MNEELFQVAVLVKATPVLTSALEESMCVAGVSSGPIPEWIRLNPVPFRYLEDAARFAKYDVIRVRAVRNPSDRRPESWRPIEDSIEVVEPLGLDHGWSRRKEIVAALDETTMCELVRDTARGSGVGIRSLGVIRPVGTPNLVITKRNPEQLRTWEAKASAIAVQSSLFGSRSDPKPPLEAIPWSFKYRYRCADSECNGHTQSIIDWEVVALYRNVRDHPDWEALMRTKLVDEMWAQSRDTVLFVGNQALYPQSFLVLGVFWPPKGGIQTQLVS